MSFFWRKCQVLMWKNVIVRKRHWFLTLIELVFPILLFWLVAWMRQNSVFGQQASEVPTTVNPLLNENTVRDYSFIHHDVVNFAYTPDTPFTRKVITELNKTLIYYLKDKSKLESFDVVESEYKLEEFFHLKYENVSTFTNYIGYGIVFENVGNGSEIPKDFKYKIRSTIPKWDTKDLFPQFLPAGPTDQGDSYLYKGFLAVQMAVDNAYIKVASESVSSKYETSIRKFPFPKYTVDIFNELFKSFMPFFTMLSFATISISVLKKVVEEKSSGVSELMKMMGLQTWMVWAGWVLNGLMVYIISCSVITFLLCHGFDPDKGPVIAHTDFTVVFVLFLLFCLASICFCFAISSFFLKPTLAMSVGMAVWVVSFGGLQQHVSRPGMPFILQLLLQLIPTLNMSSGYIVIAAFESRGAKISWLSLLSDATGGNGQSLGLVMVMFIVQMCLYMFVTWYVTSIRPGPYGRARPWYFIFQCMSTPNKRVRDKILHNDDDDDEHYEPAPKDMKIGLRIQDLRKEFGSVVAVDKVNLDIYEGQITALLGHNGAGKTTTMSMLTGMFSPTAGAVYAKDYNIFENMDRFRNSLGLCPQHDLLFPYFTVMEHLVFFGMLKGMGPTLAGQEGEKLLQLLRIMDKKNVLADKLSGGMKRKLSLAISLMGSPQVLVLDEPTSGMDPESRREMWDLLLKLRGERTVLITTHFMEEADVLGDRIAIMDHGRVKCYGTTLFLKRIYGTGYHLTVMKSPQSPVDPITQTIKSKVVIAEVKNIHPTQVTYSVPQEYASNLPGMFAALEARKVEMGIDGMGISCTTMEEVFLKVGQLAREEKMDFDKSSRNSKENTMVRNNSQEALEYKRLRGVPLFCQQFKSLFHKRMLFTTRRPVTSIVFFLLPLLMTWMTVKNGLMDVMQSNRDPPLTMNLGTYGRTDSYVSGPYQYQDVYKMLVKGQEGTAMSVEDDMIGALLQQGEKNVARYKTKVIVAADFNTSANTATALYNGIAFHSSPIAVNLISNTLLRASSNTANNTITTTNHPLDIKNFVGACSQLNDISLWMSAFMWLILVPMGIKGFVMDFIHFPHFERVNNAKQLQLMTGVMPVTYWAACFSWDYIIYCLSGCTMFFIIWAMDSAELFTEARDYGVFSLILLTYGVSATMCAYVYSFIGKSATTAASVFTLLTLFTGMIAPMVMHFMLRLSDSEGTFVSSALIVPLDYLLSLDPTYAFGSAIMNFAYILSEDSACSQCDNKELKAAMCTEKSYLSFPTNENPNGLLQYVIFLAFDWMLYMGILLLIEYGYMSRAFHWLKVQWVGKDFDKLLSEDSDVRDERDRVDAVRIKNDVKMNVISTSHDVPDFAYMKEKLSKKLGINRSVEEQRNNKEKVKKGGDDSVMLVVDGLAKKFSRSFAAVQGVSFRVSAGECFGLLGVNGAGKTTTFRMLTGDENPTAGNARIQHYDLVRNRSKYLSQIGYCPQYDGINTFLTGEEMLRLFANLRGIPEAQIQPQINDWISLLGLDEYRHRRSKNYSGGNKRKLSTAMALIGDPPVVFLDEPTTGVDPVARRNLWDVLGRCQKSGQAIILTSHSMEECEALCTRLTIMVRGRMKCIGSNQYLKQRYGQGYTIMIKLHTLPAQDNLLQHLKMSVERAFTFNCTLKDEHKSLLHYQMTDTNMPLSQIFSEMEELKKVHSIVEDYTVGDTTLEQVFISFARQGDS
ncbi:retinal-specific phospholipid-transporting ATPase ABCA4-like isoform X1 [Macrosteles quadrilineatus]|uniref:retinal-specific phospholipid-transporting ATPase ABCA4-like isoform X1 n=1 Tax=Macrosteles quadrilineatus TaxID=74068 RepID=UPI0023E0CA60|nr:retinal-specific phospholipid-transporting ATPase ABCA4-like isoform X1 [Macrosteles quadrilineatus]